MNNDLISREALKKEIENLIGYSLSYEAILNAIDNAPTVEGRLMTEKELDERDSDSFETGYIKGICEQRPQGEWIEYQEDNEIRYYCSICQVTKGQAVNNFCACCGADMKGGAE